MKTGIIELKFTENVSDETIQEMVNDFYLKNEFEIKGMEFKQLIDENTLKNCHRAINDALTTNTDGVKECS